MSFHEVLLAMDACAALIKTHLNEYRGTITAQERKCTQLEYCLKMVERAHAFSSDQLRKAATWLGFIQGAMWAHQVASVEDLKEVNRQAIKELP